MRGLVFIVLLKTEQTYYCSVGIHWLRRKSLEHGIHFFFRNFSIKGTYDRIKVILLLHFSCHRKKWNKAKQSNDNYCNNKRVLMQNKQPWAFENQCRATSPCDYPQSDLVQWSHSRKRRLQTTVRIIFN